MILRTRPTAPPPPDAKAWECFARTQQWPSRAVGCISQPAHAALAGRLAASLNAEVFGELPRDVVETVRLHDAGWAYPDLMALECAVEAGVHSFLQYPAERAVDAWTQSVREAEERCLLSGILTNRHFCLLAPRDGSRDHETFVTEETQRRELHEGQFERDVDGGAEQLNRFTAALGFCDLLSLCLCSGLAGTIHMPLAHPADPASERAEHVAITIAEGTLHLDRPILHAGSQLYLDTWQGSTPGPIKSHRLCWRVV